MPQPKPPATQTKYSVVVNEVPVKEVLFALARDAKVNVDIDPRIQGVVTLNAVDQTLPQLLERISRQVDLRYEIKQDNLTVTPDEPYFKTYKVGYLNMSRETTGSVSVSTQIASTSSGSTSSGSSGGGGGGGGGGGNTSTTEITSESNHEFWKNLESSINAILKNGNSSQGGATGTSGGASNAVVVSPESGIVTVLATARQHEVIQKFIDQVLESVRRQVMIQATVVEVNLNHQYQSGIDWKALNLKGTGFSLTSSLLGGAGLSGPPLTSSSFVMNYLNNSVGGGGAISAAVSLLSEFGNTKVLSSPQIMALNNQTAVLKVVENFVYFDIKAEVAAGNQNTNSTTAYTTTPQTVPIGLILTVTPQISSDDSVTLDIRPTISSVIRTEQDPNPELGAVKNLIPVVRVREMESILKVDNRQIAVLGGLMQDTYRNNDRETPGAAHVPLLGELFKSKDRESLKTELVIFLRPIVVKNASIEGDLNLYNGYLPAPK